MSRRIVLFLVACLIPGAVVAALAVRTLAQDRELTARRAEDDRRHMTITVRQELLARLERLKASALTAPLPDASPGAVSDAVALIASADGDRLVLPWDPDTDRTEARAALSQMRFADAIARGEREELQHDRPRAAVVHYRQAAASAVNATQAAYADLLLARAYAKAGLHADAIAADRRTLARPAAIVDDLGIPLALYAALRVAQHPSTPSAAKSALDAAAAAARLNTLSPIAWQMSLAIVNAAAAVPAVQADAQRFLKAADVRTRRFEQAIGLQRAFPAIATRLPKTADASAEPVWIPFGGDMWLVGLSSAAHGTIVVAVDAQRAFSTLDSVRDCRKSGRCSMRLELDGRGGDPLGASLPGVALDYLSIGDASDAQRLAARREFYVASLVAIVALSLAGAYLLARDLRRELKLAEVRSQFVASVSHELKTPLTAIRMFAETLRMGRPSGAAERDEYLDTIVSESERLTRLLNNVLEFSRIEQGLKRYQRAAHDLAPIVHAALGALRYPLTQQGFEVAVAVDESVPPVMVDPDAMEQAILNLLTNAMKYSGGGTSIELRVTREGRDAAVAVSDHGIGIAPTEQRRIFEKFYRAPTAETQRIPGTGLGLTLVDHIVRSHDGSVTVESTPGKGSTFTIRVPIEAAV